MGLVRRRFRKRFVSFAKGMDFDIRMPEDAARILCSHSPRLTAVGQYDPADGRLSPSVLHRVSPTRSRARRTHPAVAQWRERCIRFLVQNYR